MAREQTENVTWTSRVNKTQTYLRVKGGIERGQRRDLDCPVLQN